jgi:hypothetical protein
MADHGGGLNQILTIGAVGVGAYFLWQWWQQQQAGTTTVTPPPPGTTTSQQKSQGTTSVSTSPSTTPTGIQTKNTITQIIDAMNAAGDDPTKNHSVWQFNYYWTKVTGVSPAPDPTQVLPGNPNATTQLIDINTWWAGMQKAGFSGLGAHLRYPGPYQRQVGNMIFGAQHPLPYAPTYTLFSGLRGFTQASGMEKALWAGTPVNRHWW